MFGSADIGAVTANARRVKNLWRGFQISAAVRVAATRSCSATIVGEEFPSTNFHCIFTVVTCTIAHDTTMHDEHRRRIRWAAYAAAVGCVLVAATPPISGQSDRKPDITGTWVLNRELSDRPESSGARDGGAGGEGRRSPRGGGMGRPGMGGRGGRGRMGRGGDGMPNQDDMQQRRAAMDGVLRQAPRMVIVAAESGYLLTYDDGVSVRIPAEGKK